MAQDGSSPKALKVGIKGSGSQVLVSGPGVSSGSSYTLTIGFTSTTVSGTKSGSSGGRW
ncbi:MAG: hypothetical protein SPF56_02815 [Bacteroidaceae bacterium]|nr:hypothetical protein [Prevotellaceae bacterium]MDY5631423.1 hypothetical protein [Bacteroidaceae bacterium]